MPCRVRKWVHLGLCPNQGIMSEKLFGLDEIKLIGNSSYLLQKNRILKKIIKSLSETGEILATEIQNNYPQIASKYTELPYKVSIGEKYNELPYLVMDFPRHFDDKKTFSFRVLFLWGHYFNFSLHLGSDLIDKDSLFQSLSSAKEIYFCIHETPWHHYFTEDNFKLGSKVTSVDISNQLSNNNFVKISERIEFHDIKDISDHSIQEFRLLTEIAGITGKHKF